MVHAASDFVCSTAHTRDRQDLVSSRGEQLPQPACFCELELYPLPLASCIAVQTTTESSPETVEWQDAPCSGQAGRERLQADPHLTSQALHVIHPN